MKKNKNPQAIRNRWFHTFAALVLAVLIAIPTIFVFSPNAANVKLNKTSVTMNVKETCKLKVKNTSKKVKWTTSNKKVATVSQKGKVTAKKKGTATITAKVGGKKLTCKVTVKPSAADTKDVAWATNDKSVATVTAKGVIKAVGNGTAVITATAKDGSGKSASCTVKVSYTCNHSYGKAVVTKAATCVDTGVKTYTCKKCGATKTASIPATGEHSWDTGVVTKATCTENGKETFTCTICGSTESYTIPTNGTGHEWDGGKITSTPTCAVAGVKTYTCKKCGITKSEAIAATGEHSWVEYAEEGHYGTVTVYISAQVCNTCGKGYMDRRFLDDPDFFGVTEAECNAANIEIVDDGEETHAAGIHNATSNDCENWSLKDVPVNHWQYIVDKEAYTQCSVCGAIK